MNSYFGWDYGVAGDYDSGTRGYGGGNLKFMYSNAPEERYRSPEKVLLFAEMPFVENGVQSPDWNTSADKANDMILQYLAEGEEEKKSNKASDGTGEAIGFNHRSGKTYSAHVAFADGHCIKLSMPASATEDDLIKLTTWLCTGQEYTFNGSRYEKVSE